MTLRIETYKGFRSGSLLNSGATVEWAGRIGHPSSYALLGGNRFSAEGVKVFSTGSLYKEALAASVEEIRWGLPPEYEEAVMEVLMAQPQPVVVSKSAYGEVSSSVQSFRTIALMLCQILSVGLPEAEDDVWKLFDRCRNEAGGGYARFSTERSR
jgi:hypothetical protein